MQGPEALRSQGENSPASPPVRPGDPLRDSAVRISPTLSGNIDQQGWGVGEACVPLTFVPPTNEALLIAVINFHGLFFFSFSFLSSAALQHYKTPSVRDQFNPSTGSSVQIKSLYAAPVHVGGFTTNERERKKKWLSETIWPDFFFFLFCFFFQKRRDV